MENEAAIVRYSENFWSEWGQDSSHQVKLLLLLAFASGVVCEHFNSGGGNLYSGWSKSLLTRKGGKHWQSTWEGYKQSSPVFSRTSYMNVCQGQARILCFSVLVGLLRWFLRTFSVTNSATKRLGCNVYLSSCNQETKSLVMRDPGRQPPTRQPFCCPEFIFATYYIERTGNGGTYPQDMPRKAKEEALSWHLGNLLTTDAVKRMSVLVKPAPSCWTWFTRGAWRWKSRVSLGSFHFHDVADKVAW